MNKPVTVRTLLGDYPVTQPLKKGEVKSPSVSLDFADVKTVSTAFKRVVRNLEFDCAELAIVTFLMAKAHGKPFVLLHGDDLDLAARHPRQRLRRGPRAREVGDLRGGPRRRVQGSPVGGARARRKGAGRDAPCRGDRRGDPALRADRPAAQAAHSRSGEGGRGLAQEIRRAADQPHGGGEGFPVEIRSGRGARDLPAPRREQEGGEAAEARARRPE